VNQQVFDRLCKYVRTTELPRNETKAQWSFEIKDDDLDKDLWPHRINPL
jgi:hypothetical protein